MKTYGLIGKDISYSFSKKYFTEKFKQEGLCSLQYVNFDIQDISEAQAILSDSTLGGLNVTIPYKETIIPFLDGLSHEASTIGAVNTIRFLDDGKKIGYNTDYIGFRDSLIPLLRPYHTKALILGTGGAAKAVAYALGELNIPFLNVSRQKNEGQISYEEITPEILKLYTIIINCTPIGTFPNKENNMPISTAHFTSDHLVYDLIYNPEMTVFLHKAKEKGAIVKNGYEMLKIQAEHAWKIWNL